MEKGPEEPSNIIDFTRQWLSEENSDNGEERLADIIPMHYPFHRVYGLVYPELHNNKRTSIELTSRQLSIEQERQIHKIVDRARMAGDNELSYYAWHYLQNTVDNNGDLQQALDDMDDFIRKFKSPREYT